MKMIRFGIILLILALALPAGPTPGSPVLASQLPGEQRLGAPDPALTAIGPIDPQNGFPLWYRDSTGLQLRLCVGDPVRCLFTDPPIAGNAFSQQIGFGANAFYMRARADLNAGPNGDPADLELALKAAFTNGPPANGQQVVFGRIRFRAAGLENNTTYVLTHPYGVDNIPTDNNGNIDFSLDVGCTADDGLVACDFTRAFGSRVDPFLTAVAPAPPAGFIGDPTILQTLTGSPFGTNFFRIQGTNAGGQGVNVVQTDLFRLQGQRFNSPPVAVNDSATVAQNSINNPINVLANDSDPEGSAISVTAVTQGTNGTVAVGPGGANVLYSPTSGFFGSDTFTYTVSDGSLASTATVSVTVNRAPTASPDAATVSQNSANNTINVLANDSDPDGNAISITAVTQGTNGGAVSFGGGSVVYTPVSGFAGTETFTYTISDGLLAATATVTVTVNRVPSAVNDTVVVLAGSSSNPVNVLANDSDPDGNTVIVTAVTQGANGSVAPGAGGANVLYTPAAGFAGNDAFSYTISDGFLTSGATVSVTVQATNRAPLATNDSVVIAQDSAGNVINVLANDSDPDANPISIISASTPLHGAFALGHAGATIVYTPTTGFVGADTFTYTVSDGSLTAAASVNLTVTASATNRAPIAATDAVVVGQNSANNSVNVLANDTDPDGNPTMITAVTQGANGTVTIGPDGTRVIYTPNLGFAGSDTFTYTISDGALTTTTSVTVTVAAAATNQPPVASNDAALVTQGSTINVINVLANDSDPDGNPLTVTSVSTPLNGTASVGVGGAHVHYTPNAGFIGVDTFNYSVSDGSITATGTVLVEVRRTANQAPAAANDTSTVFTGSIDNRVNVLGNDSDPDGDSVRVIATTQGGSGTVTIGPGGANLLYTPDPTFGGVDSFTYTITDGSLTATGTVIVTTSGVRIFVPLLMRESNSAF